MSSNFLYMLPVAVAQSSSNGNVIILRTSGFVDDVVFSYNAGENQRRRAYFVELARWRHRGRRLPS